MGRKKSRPVRSGGLLPDINSSNDSRGEHSPETDAKVDVVDVKSADGNGVPKQFFVDVDSSHWESDEHFDIAEIILKDIKFDDGIIDHRMIENRCTVSNIYLRFKLPDEDHDNFRLGYWPVLSADCICMEFVDIEKRNLEDKKVPTILFSGTFDGPGESVSGLVHLVSMKFMTLRPVSPIRILGDVPSIRLRVEILKNAFEACESLLEVARKPWRKSMISVMSWLRPEVTTSEARYGTDLLKSDSGDAQPEAVGGVASGLHPEFDAARFYEAIKPSK